MSDCTPQSNAFSRYRRTFDGAWLVVGWLIISGLLLITALWNSGLRQVSSFWQITVILIALVMLAFSFVRMRRLTTFDLLVDPDGEGIVLDGTKVSELTVAWRGPIAFLQFESSDLRIAVFADGHARREFKLALVHWNTTLRNQSMAT